LPGCRINVMGEYDADFLQWWRLPLCCAWWHVQQPRSRSCHTWHIHLNRQQYGLVVCDRYSIHGNVGRASVIYMPVEANHCTVCPEHFGQVLSYPFPSSVPGTHHMRYQYRHKINQLNCWTQAPLPPRDKELVALATVELLVVPSTACPPTFV
jgi:hypothetical protein